MSAARQGHRATFLGNAAEGWLQRTGGLQKRRPGSSPRSYPARASPRPAQGAGAPRIGHWPVVPGGADNFSAETTRRRIH